MDICIHGVHLDRLLLEESNFFTNAILLILAISLKYIRFTQFDCKDKGIRKFEFLSKK